MFKRDIVKEGSSSKLIASFFDEAGNADVPSSVTVQIQCLSTGSEIRAAQSMSPAAVMTIDISSTENRIIDATNAKERRRVTVKTTYGNGGALNEQFDYIVQNLSQVS